MSDIFIKFSYGCKNIIFELKAIRIAVYFQSTFSLKKWMLDALLRTVLTVDKQAT